MSMFEVVTWGVVVLFIGGVAGLAVRLTRRPRGRALVLTATRPGTVWVTMYDHKHGTDIEVFHTEEAAELFRQQLAAEWWDDEMEGSMPTDPKEAADAYFAAGQKHGEWFDVREQRVRQ